MCSQNKVNSLTLEGIKDLSRGFLQVKNKPLECFLNVGFSHCRVFVSEITLLELDPPPVCDLDFFSQVGQVKHVRKGFRNNNRVARIQACYHVAEFIELLHVVLCFILRGHLIAFLNLSCRRRGGHGGRRGIGRGGARRTR
ncbi:Os09g0315750 [Oryza sativa Japonica Group]|uniref:Os09g0315750 protein n=1 Tax=Oryza sativa subsp. japonica TaxID=39947 RepID=A0A0P0XL83_ORYSJ|nr:Os09g0315750 [Oryza sativa Japonica Group]